MKIHFDPNVNRWRCAETRRFAKAPKHKDKAMPHRLSRRSIGKMKILHDDIRRVVFRASEILYNSPIDFRVGECDRTKERQRRLVDTGASKTMNSRHMVTTDGKCHAVDLIALVDGKVTWNWAPYHKIAKAMKQAARELGISIEWGGDWKTFPDGPHYQLPWKEYP